MQKLHDLMAWAESRRELWLDCVRIYLGLGLFARGLLLIWNVRTDFFINMLSRSGETWLLSATLLHYVALAHFVGGAMLTLGLLTRLAALVQIPILVGAVFIVHRPDGLFALGQSLEFSALVLFLLCVICISGAGRLSLDHVIFREHPQPDAREPIAQR
ncbi:MAG TPA: DoxX family protein [Opitutaceae bacterium]|nr:DoxX family protein [Opitutaceae bacterium]